MLDPPFSASHWVPQMIRLAGGEVLSARLSWEEVFEATPQGVVLMPCGFDAARTLREACALPELPGCSDLPAAKSGRVWAVDGATPTSAVRRPDSSRA